ncbi:unnamed protein product [Leuciscus chuanchicus]
MCLDLLFAKERKSNFATFKTAGFRQLYFHQWPTVMVVCVPLPILRPDRPVTLGSSISSSLHPPFSAHWKAGRPNYTVPVKKQQLSSKPDDSVLLTVLSALVIALFLCYEKNSPQTHRKMDHHLSETMPD